MYQFQINAHTQAGESIGLVGSTLELGSWDISQCIRLHTSGDCYPLWRTDRPIDIPPSLTVTDPQKVEYKYVRLDAQGNRTWEATAANRWIPIEVNPSAQKIVVDDGAFGYWQPYPFGYYEEPALEVPAAAATGLKIVAIGSSVALGQKAWLLAGWAERLGKTLQEKYGHRLVNVSEAGANVSRTIARFGEVVTPEQPDVVIIALSLGNEGLAHCPPHQRRSVQRQFESGLQQLIQMTRAIGAQPMLGGVYPHGDYSAQHYEILLDTHHRLGRWDVPMLDWLAAVDNGQGRWKSETSFDPAHPNTHGHQLMYEAIDLSLFPADSTELAPEQQRFWQPDEIPIHRNEAGFYVCVHPAAKRLRISNSSQNSYNIAPDWLELQTVLKAKGGLMPGIYLADNDRNGISPFLAVQADGTIATKVIVPTNTEIEYRAAFDLLAANSTQVLFNDGQLGIWQKDATHLWIVNESDHEYNIQPMWPEVRRALSALPAGVYEDPLHPHAPFRTLLIGRQGLESRVKIAPQSAVLFQYKCPLTEINRVGIIPLGDRCAVRMMLYKMGFDGPAFPFDLTRTSTIADVANIIESKSNMADMWNPNLIYYSPETRRIHHRKWVHLSFGHEIEDSDNPLHDMSPIHERMRQRYSARAERFWYTIHNCDRVLFIRTGGVDRGGAIDLLDKLQSHCQNKPFHLLILSLQDSNTFVDLPHVLHYNVEFNPDRMYDDRGHWQYCAEVMHGILKDLGVSSKNLFWCPPHPAQEMLSNRS